MRLRKHMCAGLIMALVLTASLPVQAESPAVVWSTANLNVRTGPSTDYEKVGMLRPSDAVSVVSEEGGWYQISYGDGTAWICAAYTQNTEPAAETTSTAVPGIAENLDSVSSRYINSVNSYLAYVPENSKAAFVNRGWHVYVTQMNLASTFFPGVYGSVRACTVYGSKAIYVEDRDNACSSIVHEMGHFLDNQCGTPSLSSEFADIYNAEVNTFKAGISNASSVRDPMEFFAETFAQLCMNPGKCTPRAAEFVSRYLGAV